MERCFVDCVSSFRSKNLDSTEEKVSKDCEHASEFRLQIFPCSVKMLHMHLACMHLDVKAPLCTVHTGIEQALVHADTWSHNTCAKPFDA